MNERHKCLLCLGSNVDGIHHLKNAEQSLNQLFGPIRWGTIIETEPWGTNLSGSFFNRAASLYTSLSSEELVRRFKQIECRNGRTSDSKARGVVPLDIDLLAYDDRILKPDDLEKEYVKQALSTLR